jgi:type II secretion system protein J
MTMRSGINPRRNGGFSLLEILLALTIFAMVLTAIYSSWIAIMRSSKIGLEAAADVQRARISIQTLEDALSCARSFAADVHHYSFLGENGSQASLSFVAQLPEVFPRSGKFGDFDVRRVTFALEPGPDSGNQFVLRQNPILMDLDKDELQHPIVLARNVKEFDMAFWNPTKAEWIDEWTQTNQMPLMVKVTLVFNGPKNSSQGLSETTRVIGLPSVMVQANWQTPGAGRGGARTGLGVQPGIQPGRQPGSGPSVQPGGPGIIAPIPPTPRRP